MIHFLLGLALVFSVAGCGPKAEEATTVVDTSTESAAPVAKKTLDPAQAGSITGHVRFEGIAPEVREVSVKGNPECAVMHAGGTIKQEEFLLKDGNLQNVFVYVKAGLEGYDFPVPAEPVTVDNRQCVYVPHVAGAQVKQPVNFLNSDPTLHNVHAYAKTNKSWNLGLPIKDMKSTKAFTSSEVMVKLKCDVHPWMTGYIGILPHPYFQVTGEDGAFNLKNLPAGTYEIEVWHEKLGVQSQTITIEPQGTKTVDFTFKN